MLGVGTMRESEVLDFHQRNGENMKKAWDRISEAHKDGKTKYVIRGGGGE